MMRRIGYACLAIGVKGSGLSSCTSRNADEEKLTALIGANLEALNHMLDYNIENRIRMFRISSDIIPFGSSPVNSLRWWSSFEQELTRIGQKARDHEMRLSMHPGQYTVLNSPDPGVVERAIEDLRYHNRFLDALGLDGRHKIILHVGGAYGDKQAAMERFAQTYQGLDSEVKKRLVIENDDRIYNVEEVLHLGESLNIPVVFDNLHHEINPPVMQMEEMGWLERCGRTWREQDGCQKIHYAQQAQGKRQGSHSATISLEAFLAFYQALPDRPVDIMLEVKDKNLSALKCLLAVDDDPSIRYLEQEWSRYKYTVLEHDANCYQTIRRLLKEKATYPVVDFYEQVQRAMEREVDAGSGSNALQHVWGYFKDQASAKEKTAFMKALAGYRAGTVSINAVKGHLKRMTEKYEEPYLRQSLYFDL